MWRSNKHNSIKLIDCKLGWKVRGGANLLNCKKKDPIGKGEIRMEGLYWRPYRWGLPWGWEVSLGGKKRVIEVIEALGQKA